MTDLGARIVDVVAPSSACSAVQLESGLATLTAWGLTPRVPPDLFGPKGMTAHDDATRWRHLRRAVCAEDSELIWAVRGGYGALRLVDSIAKLPKPRRRKVLVGFSDITVVQHLAIRAWSWVGVHAPMVGSLAERATLHREIRRAVLQQPARPLTYRGLEPLNRAARATPSRDVQGRLLGGNLKTFQSMLGTQHASLPARCLLFFEDIGERGYAIDRMLVQMRLAGFFRGVKAIVFGTFVGGEEPDGTFTGEAAIAAFAAAMRVPVFRGLSVGHHPETRVLPLGTMASLSTGRRGTLRIGAGWRPV
ncbi:MAG: LD-carboxypeptidase [Pseudomonadota bacterium]